MVICENERPEQIVIELSRALKPKSRVLELHCKTGRNLLHLASQGHIVEGWEPKPEHLARLKQTARERSLEITTVPCDMRDLRVENWDAVITVHSLQDLMSECGQAMLERISRGVVSGGMCALSIFTNEGGLFKKYQRHRYFPSEADILAHFNDWDVILTDIQELEFRYLNGESLVFRNRSLNLLARKR